MREMAGYCVLSPTATQMLPRAQLIFSDSSNPLKLGKLRNTGAPGAVRRHTSVGSFESLPKLQDICAGYPYNPTIDRNQG